MGRRRRLARVFRRVAARRQSFLANDVGIVVYAAGYLGVIILVAAGHPE